MKNQYVMGLDFGTDSVRALVINPSNGKELGIEVVYYPRWKKGLFCNPALDQFRQHPLDYLESMEQAIKGAIKNTARMTKDNSVGEKIIGLGVDTTGSTPIAVDKNGLALALHGEFSKNPNAMFILWKDHTAKAEAQQINQIAHSNNLDYTKYSGGVYSSEWYFSKILHILREDKKVRHTVHSWVEHCDWIVGNLIGNLNPNSLPRSRCAAGHKAMWHASWNGLPDQDFLTKIDPHFQGIREKLFQDTLTSDKKAGTLSTAWSKRLGLSPHVSVAVGAFDAHMGAVGAGIESGILSKIIGTSTCDMVIASPEVIGDKLIGGICGQVDGSIIPGFIGLEAGQSSAGDDFAWIRDLNRWAIEEILPSLPNLQKKGFQLKKEMTEPVKAAIYKTLTNEALKLKAGQSGLLALDWFNGRRTPFADQSLRGALIGMNLGSSLPAIYRSIVESVALGAKKIIERFHEERVVINSVIACGGLSKIDFVMQIHSDVLGMPIKVSSSDQTCALGAAIFAAVSAGLYPTIEKAQKKMCPGFSKTYKPNTQNHDIYNLLYRAYEKAGEALAPVMKDLMKIQQEK